MHTSSRFERACVWLGLRLVWLIVWATDRLDRSSSTRLNFALGHLALAFVSVVGWVVDRLPS